MRLAEVAERLGIEEWRIKGALERQSIQQIDNFNPPYLIFRKDVAGVERGTAVFLGEEVTVVRGFPKIMRAFYLEPLVRRHFSSRVAVEEKMNGYNVRVALVEGRVLALTRGGYVCPYTTARLSARRRIGRFLKENPGKVLCGEAVGTRNPYVVHHYPEAGEFGFFAFDIRDAAGNRAMPVLERNRLLEEYGIEHVRFFGIFKKEEATEAVFRVVRELAQEGREGVVIKDPEMRLPPIKYTSSQTNASDLAYAFRFPYEYGRDFFFSRIIREGFQAVEWDEGEAELEERALRLGKSILLPMVESIRRVRDGEVLTEDHVLDFAGEEELEEFLTYLRRQGVSVVVDEVERKDGGVRVVLRRLRRSSTDRIRSVLSGRGE
ncbi:MAG: RNA ligase [Euryarchaeota archaeon]|nr:RNA ligase [Euryarchaeota archaeon]